MMTMKVLTTMKLTMLLLTKIKVKAPMAMKVTQGINLTNRSSLLF